MKAIVIEKTGGPEELKLGEFPTPKLRKNEVLVRLGAAGINYVDVWVRKGGAAYPVPLPHVPGADGAGTVAEIGPEAEGISVGERVAILPAIACGDCAFCRNGRDNQCDRFEILGAKRPGTYAEFVAVPDENVITLPDHVSFEKAAAFPLAYLTAWHMLIGRAQVKKGETVLVIGAGGGVGAAAVQIAKSRGARVLAVTSSPDKSDGIRKAGADDVYVIEGETAHGAWARDKTGGAGVQVVVETVGPATWNESLTSLAKYGRLTLCGVTTGPTASLDLRTVFGRDLSLLGVRMGTRREFQELARAVFSGAIDPLVDRTFPLAEAAAAHAHLEAKRHLGKIVLTID